jgi:hypothetical protein
MRITLGFGLYRKKMLLCSSSAEQLRRLMFGGCDLALFRGDCAVSAAVPPQSTVDSTEAASYPFCKNGFGCSCSGWCAWCAWCACWRAPWSRDIPAALQAAKLFAILDVDGNGAITLADWTNAKTEGLALLLTFKMIRRELVGNDPLAAKRPPSSVRSWNLRRNRHLMCDCAAL